MDKITLERIKLIHPKYRDEVFQIYEEICKELTGDAFCRFTHTYRDEKTQNALYAQGRTTPGSKVTNARWLESEHNFGIACYDEKTKIFTDQGIKYFYELNGSEEVLTFKNGELEYQKPLRYIVKDFEGDMVRVKTRSVDLLVTPDHKMIVKKSVNHKWNEHWEEIEAKDLDHRYKIPTSGTTIHKGSFVPEFEYYKRKLEIENDEDWYEFLGYYISEGYCTGTKTGIKTHSNRFKVGISQCKKSNPEVWQKIASCLDRLKFKYSYQGHEFVIHNKALWETLFPLGNSYKKHIPHFYLKSDKRLLEKLYVALIDGDGTYYENGEAFFTVSKRLADDFKQLSILLNKSCFSYVKMPDKNHIMPHGEKSKTFNPQYVVRTRKRNTQELRNGNNISRVKKEYYKGLVFCVTTEAGAVVVERNNKVCISGNCDIAMIYNNGKSASWDTAKDWDKDGVADWLEVVKIFNKYNWKWGFFNSRGQRYDLPHFGKNTGYTVAQLRNKYKKGDVFIDNGIKYVNI